MQLENGGLSHIHASEFQCDKINTPAHVSSLWWSGNDVQLIDLDHPGLALDVAHRDLELQLANVPCRDDIQ